MNGPEWACIGALIGFYLGMWAQRRQHRAEGK